MPDRRPSDYFLFKGAPSPGLLDPARPFPGADVPRNYQQRTGFGIDSSWLFYYGIKLSEFDARFHVYPPSGNLDEYLAADPIWKKFAAAIARPQVGARQQPGDISHFLLEQLFIRTAVVVNELVWEQTGPGVWTKVVKFKVYRAPRPVLAKQIRPDARPVATNERQKKILGLVDQLNKLAGSAPQ